MRRRVKEDGCVRPLAANVKLAVRLIMDQSQQIHKHKKVNH